MAVVFVKDFVMVEGDASIRIGKGEIHNLEYVNTHRDITPGGMMMEAAIYRVSEELLQILGNSSGRIRFRLSASEAKDQEIKAMGGNFSELDEYIAETKATLGILFESK